MLVEAAPSDAETLVAAGAVRRDDMRASSSRTAPSTPPPRPRAGIAAAIAAASRPVRRPLLVVVQFIGPPKDDWLAELRATGVRIVSPIAVNAQLVHAEGDARGALRRYVDTPRPCAGRSCWPRRTSSHEVPRTGACASRSRRCPARTAPRHARLTCGSAQRRTRIRPRPLHDPARSVDASAIEELTTDAGVIAVEASRPRGCSTSARA